jgi:hypothetical protein
VDTERRDARLLFDCNLCYLNQEGEIQRLSDVNPT